MTASPTQQMPKNVLIVDDDPATLDFLKEALEPQGYPCTDANTADQALDLLTQKNFHAVIADFYTPGEMNGIDLLENVRQTSPATLRILINGYMDKALDEFTSIQDKDFFDKLIQKPIHHEELVDFLNLS